MRTWILLRGLTRESRHWGNFPSTLRHYFPHDVVLACDLPGNGRLNHLTSPGKVEDMAESVRLQLTAMAIKPPYSVLAMSLGAMVAVAWTDRHPAELAACVLINTSMRPFSTFYQRLRPANYPSLLRMAMWPRTVGTWEETVMRLTSTNKDKYSSLLPAWQEWHSENPVSRLNALRQLRAASLYHAPKKKPAVPILVLASAADGLVDPACSQQLVKQWGTGFSQHPTAGHDLPLDDGDWVVRQIQHWLETQPEKAEGR